MHRARSVGKPVQRSSPSLTGVIRWGFGLYRNENGSLYRFTMCKPRHHRCEMASNSRTERVVVWLGTGQSASCRRMRRKNSRPFGRCHANERVACGKSLVARPTSRRLCCVFLGSIGTGLFRFAGCAGFFGRRVEESGLAMGFGSVAFARLTTGAARGWGRRFGPSPLGRHANPLALSSARWEGARCFARTLGAQSAVLPGVASSLPRPRYLATWLILPVVICLSQRLSHACLSINCLYYETANGSLNQL